MFNTPGGSIYASGPRGEALRESQRITEATTTTHRTNPIDLRRINVTPPRVTPTTVPRARNSRGN
jgi:hypothetical protein